MKMYIKPYVYGEFFDITIREDEISKYMYAVKTLWGDEAIIIMTTDNINIDIKKGELQNRFCQDTGSAQIHLEEELK